MADDFIRRSDALSALDEYVCDISPREAMDTVISVPAAEVVSSADYMEALRRCEQMSYLLDEKIPELRKRVDALTYHGRWIPLRIGLFSIKGYKCSVCGHVEKSDGWVYCHCGAKMDLEV